MTGGETTAATPKRRQPAKVRGIYEKRKGSGVWWIRFNDANGREHRERVGPRPAAIALHEQRRTEVRQGRKFPESMRAAAMPTMAGFAQRFMDAIALHCAAKPRTVEFYGNQLKRLLEFEPLRDARLDRIDEALVAQAGRFARPRQQPGSPAPAVAPRPGPGPRFRHTLVETHVLHPPWGVRGGCIPSAAHGRTPLHYGFAAVRSPHPRGGGGGYCQDGGGAPGASGDANRHHRFDATSRRAASC